MWSFFSRDPSKDFNYDVGDLVAGLDDKIIWTLHKGKKKNSGELVSIFSYNVKNGSETQMEIAKTALKRLKTLRHPNILTYLDSLESDKHIYLVTEYVEPLAFKLAESESNEKQTELGISWGLLQIAKGLNFLNNDCGLVHKNICIWAVFVNQAGEWKLGGVDYMCPYSESSGPPIKILPTLEVYNPPEKSNSGHVPAYTKWSMDIWGYGCLIWEVFNGPLLKRASLKLVGKIPQSLAPHYCELVGAKPGIRPKPAEFIARCRASGGFMNNNFVNTLLFLDEIQIKDVTEKTKFFTGLTSSLDSFPADVCKYKILPQLVNAYEFGNAGSAVLSPMFKLGKLLNDEEYQKKIVPCVVKLFSSTDRATRARLLQQLEHFVDHLQPSLVNDQIFPQILHGFMDTNPTIRETTVKAIMHLASKLNYNNLNVELMKHFARLQAKDDQGGIRTNTTVCLGKIANYLHPQTRQKVLIPAFCRAMRDPFPPARTAGILALAATQSFYPLHDVATKVLPSLSSLCVDTDKSVRDQAFKTIKGFLGKLERVSENPSLAAEMEAEVNSLTSPTVADTAASWAGWAVSSLTSKFYKSEKNPTTQPIETPSTTSPEKETKVSSPSRSSLPLEQKQVPKKSSVPAPSPSHNSSSEEDNWNDDWGQMELKSSKTNINVAAISTPAGYGGGGGGATDDSEAAKQGDGWEDEDWASLEDDPSSMSASSHAPMNAGSSVSLDDDWQEPDKHQSVKMASTYDWGKPAEEDFFSASRNSVTSGRSRGKGEGSWEDSSWDAWNHPGDDGQPTTILTKAQRQEKKLQRQKELQQKRAARQTSGSGAMKLGERRKDTAPF